MPIDPATAYLVGKEVVGAAGRGLKTAGTAVFAGGKKLNEYLKETMVLEQVEETGNEEFPPLNVSIPENLNRNIKLLEVSASALGTPDACLMVKDIINQINDDSYKVLIAGKFNTGKSTLLNKLLGRDILKTSAGETTKTLAWLMYAEGGAEAAWYHDVNGDLFTLKSEDIAGIPEDPPVFNIYAALNADILKHGAVLIDTPGLHASSGTAAITAKAMENTDAVVLVVDRYPFDPPDMELIETLRKEGKGDSLFIVQNKMDGIDPADVESLKNERLEKLSEMGISARIFPLSCKNLEAADNGFMKFRAALENYIKNDLQKARDAGVARRIKIVAEYLSRQCEEAAGISRLHDDEKRKSIKIDAEAAIEKTRMEVEKTMRVNLLEIGRMKNSVKDKWIHLSSALKDEVNRIIQNATDAQLENTNKLLGGIELRISDFLQNEFYAAEYEIRKSIAQSLNEVQLPALNEEARMAVNVPIRRDKNLKLPAEFGTMGLLAFTFFTKAHSFFGLLFSLPKLYLFLMLSPFINKIFEQLQKAGHAIGSSVFKSQLQKKINDQWFTIDDNVRSKIDEFFDALKAQMELCGKETIYEVTGRERGRIKMAEGMANNGKADDLENNKLKLDVISG